jgi:hypothetical protein
MKQPITPTIKHSAATPITMPIHPDVDTATGVTATAALSDSVVGAVAITVAETVTGTTADVVIDGVEFDDWDETGADVIFCLVGATDNAAINGDVKFTLHV